MKKKLQKAPYCFAADCTKRAWQCAKYIHMVLFIEYAIVGVTCHSQEASLSYAFHFTEISARLWKTW